MKNKPFAKVIDQVGSKSDTATLLGISESYVRSILCGARKVPASLVGKCVELANSKVTPKQLRPDIFYFE